MQPGIYRTCRSNSVNFPEVIGEKATFESYSSFPCLSPSPSFRTVLHKRFANDSSAVLPTGKWNWCFPNFSNGSSTVLPSLSLCKNNNLDFFTRDINLYFSCYVYSNSPEQKYFLSGYVLVLFYWKKRSLWEIYLRVSERSKSSSKLNDIEHRPPSSRYTKRSSRSSKSTDVNFER